MSLTIATWNVNSVRLRLKGIERLLATADPDVICLQETKVVNDLFPGDAFRSLGYEHQAIHGQAGYHGVAVLSRQPIEHVEPIHWCGKDDCRHLQVKLASGHELHNLYVPAGGDVPDPEANDKFAHKLDFLRELSAWFDDGAADAGSSVLLGDLNIAPLETDVWSHKQLLKVVSHTPVEVDALEKLQASADWVDAVRRIIPPSERLYSWWSYRARDWAASDRGRRLDHVWVTPDLASTVETVDVLREARGWDQPSDHVPVVVSLQ
ncbi:MAG: exodeoxyribonuclease III [Geminicoccaceae bacterium]